MERVKNLFEITSQFKCHVEVGTLKRHGTGHINDTYWLKNLVDANHDYLLQRINHKVFKDVPQLTANTVKVIAHLKNKLATNHTADPEKEVVTLVPTKQGAYYYKDSNGDYWRMCYFLRNTRSYDLVETAKQAYEGGKAFGRFQAMLSDLPVQVISEVIPDFHNIAKRLEQLYQATAGDAIQRLRLVQPELEMINTYAESMLYFQESEQLRTLPKRVIHNDTKFNNVLLNASDEAQCVIDLDTVMPGYVAYDFGDAIRTTINTAVEDEADLSKIQLNMPLFDAYTRGYLEQAVQFLTNSEVHSLIRGVLLLPYMQAVRFLTDYLNGDQYFRIKTEHHNLQRTRAQLQLLKLLDGQKETLEGIIKREIRRAILVKYQIFSQ